MKKFSRRLAATLMAHALGLAALAPLHSFAQPADRAPSAQSTKPTIVLVHGAFADSSSWDGVVQRLQARHYSVIAAANPLRGPSFDAAYVAGIVDAVKGPVVLVGHSYGGSVISAAANGKANVKALVYVAAFAPEAGETAIGLTGKFPGSTLGPTLAPAVPLADGGKDLYIDQDKFPAQFAADVPLAKARLMAVGQRPIAEAALNEPAQAAAWKSVPSWFVYGDHDKNIPPQAMAFMAQRANAQKTVVVKGASHVVMTSQPEAVTRVIVEAAGH
ncbi:alpha/beta fold hydrolase [Variovorax atrisoli]|uniref:alpha/beta fold hydrolase n=1 Tax=Variovorax atrisoli TaxID=3394203 RepID=UPI00119C7CF3|nr:alpha/beta hydrolase [Variovorax paradoxus]MDR6522012.1 pimeloyl-ACP methyl ester carboxylesterase [Variovorax paradoxus]